MHRPESECLNVYISFFPASVDQSLKELLITATENQGLVFMTKEEAISYQCHVREEPWLAIASFPKTKGNEPVELVKYECKKYYQTQFQITPNHIKSIITPEGKELLNTDFDPTAKDLSEDNALPFKLRSAIQAGKYRKVYTTIFGPKMTQSTPQGLLELYERANRVLRLKNDYASLNKRAAIVDGYRQTIVPPNTECLIIIVLISKETKLTPTDIISGVVIEPGFTKKDIIGIEINDQFFPNPDFNADRDTNNLADQKTTTFSLGAQAGQLPKSTKDETIKPLEESGSCSIS